LIEDDAPYHNNKVVQEFVEKHAVRLAVHRLPAFSPD